MTYTIKDLGNISVNCAYYDSFMGLPDDDSLVRIREGGLDDLLSGWYDFDKKEFIQSKRNEHLKEVQQILDNFYFHPAHLVERIKAEESGTKLPVIGIIDLNHLLVKELLEIPNPDRLCFNAYLFATGKVSATIGIDRVSEIYEAFASQLTNPRMTAYNRIVGIDQSCPLLKMLADASIAQDGIYDNNKQMIDVDRFPHLRSIPPNYLRHP